MIICDENCLSGVSETERVRLFNHIRFRLGAGTVGVELADSELTAAFCIAIEEYSGYINDWFLRNRLGEMLGLPSEVDFTLKYVSNSMYFEQSVSKSIAEQQGLGANGTREYKTEGINLTAGTQDYIIPANREVNDVMWYTPSFINLFGLDPFANTNIAYSEFGASFAGHTLYHVMPVFDTILTAQAAELRNRVRGAEYSYSVHPGPDGTKILRLYPIPRNYTSINGANLGIGGGASTPGTVFYRYYDRYGNYGNPEFSGTSANVGFTGTTTQGNGLVATPADAQLNYIEYARLNSVAKTWVKQFAYAEACRILGAMIRGKFDRLPIPDAEVSLNGDILLQIHDKEKDRLYAKLEKDLEELSYEKIMEKRALIQENLNKQLKFLPMGIWVDSDLG